MANPGRCRACGCTDARACPGGGCWWADAGHTLCSRCLRRMARLVLAWQRQRRVAIERSRRCLP